MSHLKDFGVKNMKQVGNWVLTDPDTNQYGRRISDFVYEFKEKDVDQKVIDITKFKLDTIEKCIASYGYSLLPGKNLIYDTYGIETAWVIAECLFECGYESDLVV